MIWQNEYTAADFEKKTNLQIMSIISLNIKICTYNNRKSLLPVSLYQWPFATAPRE